VRCASRASALTAVLLLRGMLRVLACTTAAGSNCDAYAGVTYRPYISCDGACPCCIARSCTHTLICIAYSSWQERGVSLGWPSLGMVKICVTQHATRWMQPAYCIPAPLVQTSSLPDTECMTPGKKIGCLAVVLHTVSNQQPLAMTLSRHLHHPRNAIRAQPQPVSALGKTSTKRASAFTSISQSQPPGSTQPLTGLTASTPTRAPRSTQKHSLVPPHACCVLLIKSTKHPGTTQPAWLTPGPHAQL
jgi:hypothetical protein